MGVANFVIDLLVAKKAEVDVVHGVLMGAIQAIFWVFMNTPMIMFLLVYQSIYVNLKNWAMYMKRAGNGTIAKYGLDYITALKLGNETLTHGCFYFCFGVSILTIMIIYRSFSFLALGNVCTL